MEKEITKNYSNGEVTIHWKPSKCIHSGICVNGLPDVFNVNKRPWIEITAASTDALIDQVKKCPSGALSYSMNESKNIEDEFISDVSAEVVTNGPLLVYGNFIVKHSDGTRKNLSKTTAFCRCGSSSNKPYCDGTHKKINFQG